MADDLKRVGLAFTTKGAVDFKKTMAEVNAAVKENYSAYRLAQSEWDKSTTSQEKLRAKQEYLTKQTETYSDKVTVLKKKLEELENAEEKDGAAIEKTKTQINNAQATLNNYEKELEEVNTDLKYNITAMNEFADKLGNVGEKATEAGKKLTATVTAGVVALGTASVKTAADFESGMSQVSAISGATGEDLEALSEKAREMGSKTKFSATESAEAMNYMAMAGWKTNDMLEGIEGIMNLAAASGEELATTSDIVTDALTAFGMSAEQSGHFADILATASSNANTNVSMLGESFQYCAPVAGALGYSAEDVAVALGLMANSGIKASSAGTALRTLFTNMAKPTDEMAAAMDTLGISLSDCDGNMLSFRQVMDDLRDGFGNLKMPIEEFESQASYLQNLFEEGKIAEDDYNIAIGELIDRAYGAEGALKAEAAASLAGKTGMSGLLAIINASEEDYNNLFNAIDNCDGAAESMAETMQDNLNGQITTLKSAISEAAIAIGNSLMPTIKKIVSAIQEWVTWFNSLNDTQKQVFIIVAAVVAAIGPLLIIIGKICTGVSSIITLATTLAPIIGMATGPILGIVAAIAAVIVVITLVITHWDWLKEKTIEVFGVISEWISARVEDIKGFFTGLWEHITEVWDTICNVVQVAIMLIGSILSAAFDIITLPFQFIWENCKEYIIAAWEFITTAISTAIESIKNVISTGLEIIKNVWTTIWTAIKTALSPIISAISTVISTGFNTMKTIITTVMNTVKSLITTVWNTIKSTITTVVNGIKTVVTSVFNGIKTVATTVWNGIKTAITTPIEAAKEKVKEVVEAIKGFFTGLNIQLPHIKLPHFKIEGSLSLNPPSVPSLSIEWYAKGGILNRPTIFGQSGGTLLGGGEAGPEAVLPISLLREYIDSSNQEMYERLVSSFGTVANDLLDILNKYLPYLAEGTELRLDSGTLVAELAPGMNTELGRIAIREAKR